jgi:hypothetical protein
MRDNPGSIDRAKLQGYWQHFGFRCIGAAESDGGIGSDSDEQATATPAHLVSTGGGMRKQ